MGAWFPVAVTAVLVLASLALALVVLRGVSRGRARRREVLDAAIGGGRAVDSLPPSGSFRIPEVPPPASTEDTSR